MSARWVRMALAIIGLGILSRVVQTGSILLDKYSGDALYAGLCHVLLSLVLLWVGVGLSVSRRAAVALLLMTALELFQLTQIPARMALSPSLGTRILARLLGTEFSFLDLVAYAVGIATVAILGEQATKRFRGVSREKTS